MNKILFTVLLLIAIRPAFAQVINGQSPVNQNSSWTYTYQDDAIYSSYQWEVTNGNVTSYSRSGITYSVTIYWTTAGTGTINFKVNGNILATRTVTVNCAAPSNPGVTLNVSSNTCGDKLISYSATPPTNVTWYWQTVSSGVDTSNPTNSYTATVTGTYYVRAKADGGNCWSKGSSSVSVTVNPLPDAPPVPSVSSNLCDARTLNKTGSAPENTEWYWQGTNSSGQDNSSSEATSSTYTASLNGTNTYYIRALHSSGCWSASSTGVSVTVTYTPSAPIVANHSGRFGDGPITISTDPVAGVSGYKWYLNGNVISGETSNSLSISNLTTTSTYYVATVNGSCESGTLSVNAYHEPMPVISGSNLGRVIMGEPVVLSLPGSYQSYEWRNGSNQTVSYDAEYSTSETGEYSVTVTKANIPDPTMVTFTVFEQLAGQNQNFIVSNTVLVDNITNAADIKNLAIDQVSQSVQYFDGLGQPIQSVITQGSPDKKDIVQPIAYDQFGREAVRYLPFASAETNGWFKDNALTYQADFYNPNNPTSKVASDVAPFSITIFETSHLNRVIKQGAPGTDWQPDGNNTYNSNDHTIKKAYEFNGENEVLLWTYTNPTTANLFGMVNASNGTTPVYYPANQLFKYRTKDEHGNEVIEYVDKQNRTLLKRVQAVSGTPVINDSTYACTYFVYNHHGKPVCVIPPEATKAITKSNSEFLGKSDAEKNAFLKRWAYRYTYDSRLRQTQKQIPGADPVYFVYDKRDRLVMTQDGNQRTNNRWTYTKYDALNRPVLTGIYTSAPSVGQDSMQVIVNYYYENLDAGKAWYETFTGNTADVHGYDNKSFPQESIANNYLTVTYYDNYNFKSLLTDSARYSFNNDELEGQQTSNFKRIVGQVTGMKVKVLNGGVTGYTWLNTVNYFDDRYRITQTVSDNYKNGKDRITNVYDFVGKVLKTKTTHAANDIHWKDLVGIQWLGDKFMRTAAGSGWGTSGSASVEMLPTNQDGWFEFTAVAANKAIMIGYSPSNQDAGWTTIKYALYLTSGGALQVRENGGSTNYLGGGYTYQAGDVFRIERMAGKINYYKNGVLLLQRNAVSDTLLIDLSINSSAGELASFRSSFGTFAEHITTKRNTYDHAGRLLKTFHKVNDNAEVLLSASEFNELGQLVTKKLHSEDNGNTFKQHVDYRFNIRSWLTRINNADLSPDEQNEPRDYFGMNLHYNDQDFALGNAAYFDGNISAIKWSTNLGLGFNDTQLNIFEPTQRAYKFTYDPLHRLKVAAHVEKTTGWNATTAYLEEVPEYDLNGNIKKLNRKGKNGSNMDSLAYDYGTATTASNKLLSVTDAGDRTEGFKEAGATATDYVYDNNGNMVWDRNKGGTELLTNGNFENGSSDWILTDTESRLTFTNNEVQITAGSVTAILQQTVIVKSKPYVVVIDIERTAGTLTVNAGGATSNLTATGQFVLSMTAGSSHNDFRITAGTTFAGKIKSVSVKGVTVLTYNYLNQPEIVTQAGDQQLQFIYDATGRKLAQILSKNGEVKKRDDYAGEFIYKNDTLQFIQHEEGRINMLKTEPVYEYVLRDHLGNTRITFTTKHEVETFTATLEDDTFEEEQNTFSNYNSFINPVLNHTPVGERAHVLNGGYNGQVGLAKSFAVVPGDTIRAKVYAKYISGTGSTGNLANFAAALTSAFGLTPAMTGEAGTMYETLNSFGGIIAAGGRDDEENAPKGFINILVFDKDFNLVDFTYRQIDVESTTSHELLLVESAIRHAGYAYVFLSNENATEVQIGFDDYEVQHAHSDVIQQSAFYPFGLTFDDYQKEGSLEQRWKFQKQEHINDMDLGWVSFKWRNAMPELGRFFNVDPLSEKYVHNSTYAFSENKLTTHIELEGLEALHYKDASGNDVLEKNIVYLAKKTDNIPKTNSSYSEKKNDRIIRRTERLNNRNAAENEANIKEIKADLSNYFGNAQNEEGKPVTFKFNIISIETDKRNRSDYTSLEASQMATTHGLQSSSLRAFTDGPFQVAPAAIVTADSWKSHGIGVLISAERDQYGALKSGHISHEMGHQMMTRGQSKEEGRAGEGGLMTDPPGLIKPSEVNKMIEDAIKK